MWRRRNSNAFDGKLVTLLKQNNASTVNEKMVASLFLVDEDLYHMAIEYGYDTVPLLAKFAQRVAVYNGGNNFTLYREGGEEELIVFNSGEVQERIEDYIKDALYEVHPSVLGSYLPNIPMSKILEVTRHWSEGRANAFLYSALEKEDAVDKLTDYLIFGYNKLLSGFDYYADIVLNSPKEEVYVPIVGSSFYFIDVGY